MAHTLESLLAILPKPLPGDKAKRTDTVIQLNVTVTADTADILAVANGDPDPMKAFMQGKAKITGDMSEALELVKLFMPN